MMRVLRESQLLNTILKFQKDVLCMLSILIDFVRVNPCQELNN